MICNWIFIVQSSTRIFEDELDNFFGASEIKQRQTGYWKRHLPFTVNFGLFPIIKETSR
jgi:hypothetical protein